MKNKKTTIFSILTAVCYVGYKILSGQPFAGEDFIIIGGMLGIGASAKDHNVTGGTIPQTSEAFDRAK